MSFYLHLFHGRASLTEPLSDWGLDGPWIGPLQAIRVTYAHTLKLVFCNPNDAQRFGISGEQPWLCVHQQMLLHAGVYYGEWTIELSADASQASSASLDPDERDQDAWIDSALMAAYEERSALPFDAEGSAYG